MSTKIIEINHNSTNVQELLSLLREDTEIVIMENNIPLARLTSILSSDSRIADLYPNSITITDDFDEPLTDEFWLGKS